MVVLTCVPVFHKPRFSNKAAKTLKLIRISLHLILCLAGTRVYDRLGILDRIAQITSAMSQRKLPEDLAI